MHRAAVFAAMFTLSLLVFSPAQAVGFRSMGGSVGLDLTQSDAFANNATSVGTGFDQARMALGVYINMGRVIVDHLDLVPAFDAILENDLRIFSGALEFRYRFYRTESGNGYAGAGIGLHFYRPTGGLALAGVAKDEKISLNIPIGFQRKLNGSLGWFGELKMVIADRETDSSFRFSVGLLFGEI